MDIRPPWFDDEAEFDSWPFSLPTSRLATNERLELLFDSPDRQSLARAMLEEVQLALESNQVRRALEILLLLVEEDPNSEPAWRILAKLHPRVEHKLEALGQLVRLRPRDWRSRLELATLRLIASNSEALGDYYRQRGLLRLAIDTYRQVLKGSVPPGQWESIYRKIRSAEVILKHPPLRIEHPMFMIARLSIGTTLPFALLGLIHGANTLAGGAPGWLLGTAAVLIGSGLIYLASWVPRHPPWIGALWPAGERALRHSRVGLGLIGGLLVFVMYLWLVEQSALRLAGYVGVAP